MDLTPRDENDYYRIGLWLVSKRLALLVTVFICAASLLCILWSFPAPAAGKEKGIPVFRYNSLPLKFYKGKAEVLAKSGYTAYIGQIKGGAAQGQGTLYAKKGIVLYKGRFSGNEYHGKGTLYRKDGTKEYTGAFYYGVKQGEGKLYNRGEKLIYAGNFRNDAIVYEELAGVPTEDVAARYTGEQMLYEQEELICAAMPEIHAMYSAGSGGDSVEGLWKTTGVYVMEKSFVTEDGPLETVKQLKNYFGSPEYEGTTLLQFADVAAMKQLTASERGRYHEEILLETEGEFSDARTVTGYSRDLEDYIFTFEKGGFRYTFFTYGKNGGFGMYLIEKAA